MTNRTYQAGVHLGGVSINISSDHEALITYAREHLGGLAGPPVDSPDLTAHCAWQDGGWAPEANPFTENGVPNVIGKRMLGDDDDLLWLNTIKMKGLKLRFRRDANRFHFDIHYAYVSKSGKNGRPASYIYKRYFSLMSYLVYYPVFWYLERTRGWTPIHASALDVDGQGVMIGGLGGVGKTTTSVALIQIGNANLISENLVFTDGKYLYPCYEPIRLNDDSIGFLANKLDGMREMPFPEGLKDKSLYHVNTASLPDRVPAAALFLPVFAPERYLRELESEAAAEKLLAADRLTRELDDYYWYASALEMTWPKSGQSMVRTNAVYDLAKNASCYELGIDRRNGVEAVVDDILGSLKTG